MNAALGNFVTQAEACARLGSAFTAELCRLIPDAMGETGFAERIRSWPETAAADALALRACGALHALVLGGKAPELARHYPPNPLDRAAFTAQLADVIAVHDEFLTATLDSPPQTNEVARSSMILGAALTVAKETGLPLSVFEIGASAGLNLNFSRYRYDLGHGLSWGAADAAVTIASDWSGAMPRLDAALTVVGRAGCDRNPLNPASEAQQLRLMSYVWPDQPLRMTRMRAALALAAVDPPSVVGVDAADWIEAELAKPPVAGQARLIYHTIVWQYLPEPVKARISAALEKAGAAATRETPLALFSFESDQGSGGDGALMELTLWPTGEKRTLGRADFHGRWVRWA